MNVKMFLAPDVLFQGFENYHWTSANDRGAEGCFDFNNQYSIDKTIQSFKVRKKVFVVYQSCKGLYLQVIKFTQEFGDSTMEHFCPGPPGGAHPLGVKVVQTVAKVPIVQKFTSRRILMLGNGVMSLVLRNLGTFVKEIYE